MSTHANYVWADYSGTPGTGTVTLSTAKPAPSRTFFDGYGSGTWTVDVEWLNSSGTVLGCERNLTYNGGNPGTLTRGTAETPGSLLSLASGGSVRVVATADYGNRLDRAMQSVIPGGRLTLESGVPVSTTDQTAKTSIFYTPFVHNVVPLWNGSDWVPTTFTEVTQALGTITSGRPYDVFGFLNGSALNTEILAWTSDTARATAVTLQDGRYCKSGDKTRLLLGTFYTTSTTTTEDSAAKRLLDNVYNKTIRRTTSSNTTIHTYTTGAWRQWNGGTGGGIVEWVQSVQRDAISLSLTVGFSRSSAGTMGYANIGYDATNGSSNLFAANTEAPSPGSNSIGLSSTGYTAIAAGRHFAAAVQYGETSTSYVATTIQGNIPC